MKSELPALLGGVPVRSEGPPGWPLNDENVYVALQAAWRDGSWGKYNSTHCEKLSCQLAADLDTEQVLLCSSGTAAMELALRGLNIQPGDEVILAAYDFKSNFVNVTTLQAVPVLVDIHADNWNLSAENIEAAISSKTKAIIASHLHGGIVPMPAIMEIAQQHQLSVIEDICQLTGGVIADQPAGSWGDVGILSFGGSKLLTAGRGGAIFSSRADILQRAKLYNQRGNLAYPLTELQAALLLPQWLSLAEQNNRRAKNVNLLNELLKDQPGLKIFNNATPHSQPAYYKVGFQYDPAEFSGLTAQQFSTAIRAEGIAIDCGFRALHRIHSQRKFRAVGSLPEANTADEQTLVLHHPVLLEEPSSMQQIATAIEKIRAHADIIFRDE